METTIRTTSPQFDPNLMARYDHFQSALYLVSDDATISRALRRSGIARDRTRLERRPDSAPAVVDVHVPFYECVFLLRLRRRTDRRYAASGGSGAPSRC